jgi:hypothetical protein
MGVFGGKPYYRFEGIFEGPMLPKMQAAVDLGRAAYTARLWDAYSDVPGEHRGMVHLLDAIGSVLEDRARRETHQHPLTGAIQHRFLSGHTAFARPLVGGCMLVDAYRVAATRDMWMDRGGYTFVHLGGVAGMGHVRLYERAHRVVTWSMHGPPPPDIAVPVVMHVCNRSDCLHPGHMVWGEDAENFGYQAHEYAMERRVAQRGF